MKFIGKTKDNGRIVELDWEEYESFVHLTQAVDPNNLFYSTDWVESIESVNFSKVFKAIESFALAKDGVNQLQWKVNELNRFLGLEKTDG